MIVVKIILIKLTGALVKEMNFFVEFNSSSKRDLMRIDE